MQADKSPFEIYFEQREKSMIEQVVRSVKSILSSGQVDVSPYITKSELSRYLKFSIPTIDKYVQQGLLPKPYQFERAVRFDKREVDEFLRKGQLTKVRDDFERDEIEQP